MYVLIYGDLPKQGIQIYELTALQQKMLQLQKILEIIDENPTTFSVILKDIFKDVDLRPQIKDIIYKYGDVLEIKIGSGLSVSNPSKRSVSPGYSENPSLSSTFDLGKLTEIKSVKSYDSERLLPPLFKPKKISTIKLPSL